MRSVLSPSIFSPVPKVTPTLAGITTSSVAVKLMLLPVIVKSVPLPSIFSPSSPKVKPILAGILISPPAPTEKLMSVPSDSIFSLPVPSNTKPTPAGRTTSAVAVKLILLPVIVKSVPLPSIFSPASPNTTPTLLGRTTSEVAVKLIAPSEVNVRTPSAD